MKIPRNFMAGTADSVVTLTSWDISIASGIISLLLKSRLILILRAPTSLLLMNQINLVLSGCKESFRQ